MSLTGKAPLGGHWSEIAKESRRLFDPFQSFIACDVNQKWNARQNDLTMFQFIQPYGLTQFC